MCPHVHFKNRLTRLNRHCETSNELVSVLKIMYSCKTKEGKTQPEHYLYCVRGKEVTNSLNQSNAGIGTLVATPVSTGTKVYRFTLFRVMMKGDPLRVLCSVTLVRKLYLRVTAKHIRFERWIAGVFVHGDDWCITMLTLTFTKSARDTFPFVENGSSARTSTPSNARCRDFIRQCATRANPIALIPDSSSRAGILKEKYNIAFVHSYSLERGWHA